MFAKNKKNSIGLNTPSVFFECSNTHTKLQTLQYHTLYHICIIFRICHYLTIQCYKLSYRNNYIFVFRLVVTII